MGAHGRRGAWAAAVNVGAVGLVCLPGVAAFYQAPIDEREDYRALIRSVAPYVQDGDAASGTYVWMPGMFHSYAPETMDRLSWYLDDVGHEGTPAMMEDIRRGHRRVWSLNFLRNPDAPDAYSVQWMKERLALAARFADPTGQILLFDGSSGDLPAPGALPSQVDFANRVRLEYAPFDASAYAGDTLGLALRWTALQPLLEDYAVFLHLIGPDGRLIAQSDGDAVNGLAPSSTWTAGRPVIDRRAVLVPQPLQPGQYELRAGLYRRSDGARLRADDGSDHAVVGRVQGR